MKGDICWYDLHAQGSSWWLFFGAVTKRLSIERFDLLL
jgi:hypothetical protein